MKALLTFLSICTVAPSFAQGPEALEGKPIPPISFNLVGGGSLNSKSLRGKVVILDFWATWCAPCVAASPTMQTLYGKYKNKGLIVVGSNITDTPTAITEYSRKHGYSYPFAVHTEDLAKKLGISAIPVFVFVDRQGIVRRVDTGFTGTSPASWEKTVAKLLKS